MSSVSLVSFNQQGNLKTVQEFRNMHRFAPIIWRSLQETYLKDHKHSQYDFFQDTVWDATWALVDDPRISYEEKIVLGCTFDYAIIRREEFAKIIECFKKYSIYRESGHLWAIADELFKLQDDESVYGVGFEHSVSDQWHEWSRKGIGENYGDGEYEDYLYQWDFNDPRTYYPFDVIKHDLSTPF